MKKQCTIVKLILLVFSFGCPNLLAQELHLDFEQPFGTQSWTENGTNWQVSTGWANIRDYTGTAYSGTSSLDCLDDGVTILENATYFNLASIYVKPDGVSNMTSLEVSGLDASGNTVGSPITLTIDPFGFMYKKYDVNLTGIKKIKFTPNGTSELGGGTYYLDYFSYTPNTQLPLKLIGFNGIMEKNNIKLNWQTAQEKQTHQFVIEHATDAKEIFTAIDSVKAAGNSNALLNYWFKDVDPVNGYNYYRLKMIDIDGNFTYSPVVSVDFNLHTKGLVVYPNPAKSRIYVGNSDDTSPAHIKLINEMGQIIKEVSAEKKSDTEIDLNNVPNGVYQVVWNNQLTGKVKTVVVNK